MSGVLLIHGNEPFLCRRAVKETITHYTSKNKFRLVRLDPSDKVGLSTVLKGSGFFQQDTLVFIEGKVSDLDLSLVESQIKEPNPSVLLLVYHEGTLAKNTKLRKLIPAKSQLEHKAPAFFKAEEFAIDFCIKESLRYGLTLSNALAKALVLRSGTDLGLLAFEIQKVCVYAASQQSKIIKPEHLAGTIASLVELSVMHLVEAISNQDLKKTVVALSRVRRTHASDPTIKCCRILGSSVAKWSIVWSLCESRLSPNVASKEMGVNTWYYSNVLLPPATLWGRQGLSKLLHVVADAERNVKEGVLDPWSGFMSLLIQAFPGETLSRL